MSAQRRTTVKDKRPAAPVAAEGSPAPVRREQRTAPEKKAVVETRQSVIATRTQSFRLFVRDSVSEMKKVNWPDQETTRNLTLLVIGISFVLGLLLGGIDFVLQQLFEIL